MCRVGGGGCGLARDCDVSPSRGACLSQRAPACTETQHAGDRGRQETNVGVLSACCEWYPAVGDRLAHGTVYRAANTSCGLSCAPTWVSPAARCPLGKVHVQGVVSASQGCVSPQARGWCACLPSCNWSASCVQAQADTPSMSRLARERPRQEVLGVCAPPAACCRPSCRLKTPHQTRKGVPVARAFS